ncbi:glycosyltransferase family 2 protein [Aeromonas encheleia]|uniref:glycosyltransferase family 2 protein n=1 Tax=Aeromonas TaxID=642 RepID=UPI001C48BEA4|nr:MULTISPECIES: glycosyltransferase family 2 protein [Aeromonas]MBV7598801.1 glycosyltransferase family 2 protein [Aeromonas sp. sia0103]UNP89666.1 glycosyltransferase family 2 protein [Aeromonas encheleia]
MKSPKLGLVTVLYNTPEVLPDFFNSLACQNYKDFILYVIDNSSKPESLSLAHELATQYGIETSFIDNKGNNVGVAAGNNQGIQAALADGCEYILIINNDLIFETPDVFGNLMQVAISGESLISPLILNYPEGKLWYAGGYFDEYRALAPHDCAGMDKDTATRFDDYHAYAPTCFLIVNRDVFKKVGMMDERYFAYYDDTDFLYRAHVAGYKVKLEQNIVISHKVSVSTGGDLSFFGAYHLTRNRIYFAKKNLPFPKREISIAYTMITRLGRIMLSTGAVRQGFIKGLVDGFKM